MALSKVFEFDVYLTVNKKLETNLMNSEVSQLELKSPQALPRKS
jgi:hypothetical protein